MGETGVIIGVVAIATTLIKLVEFLINKLVPSKLDHIEDIMEKLYDMHDHVDQDGIPVWYVPRSSLQTQDKMLKAQEKMLNVLIQVQSDQKSITNCLVRLEGKLSD